MDSSKFRIPYLDDSFDVDLASLQHYQLYPSMLPFVGSHYQRMNKRVLVIGESHYLPQGREAHLTSKNWYDGTAATSLNDVDRAWINTRGTAGSGEDQRYGSRAFSIYRNVEYAIRELLEDDELPTDNYLRYVSYYNYFQRPAETGVSLVLTDEDNSVAYNHLAGLYKILSPTHLAFVSKLAYNAFWAQYQSGDFRMREIFGTPHPSSSWWNRPHQHDYWGEKETMTGRAWFLRRVGGMRLG
ncbi:hypothetical protein [Neolewinella antarctica]|uniref:Uncharacterized protein n=1 Tax=Neolewinella antarctica TaxID=442734 RepID=A0ABX0XCQ0_9BACT|nr:hypothetical protein [Neolewinella antarctica]NJC27031.1 hypothetical protein [Neolewinella antarctica]